MYAGGDAIRGASKMTVIKGNLKKRKKLFIHIIGTTTYDLKK